jgi:pimeloyl-ACP methyl ester carboxylesterase
MSASTVVHRGCAIAFETHGSGPPVLLQHGFLSNRRSWVERGVVAELAPAYTTILVDSLGHGDSDKPADPPAYQRELRAGDIAAVLDALGIERAHIVGHDWGAAVAWAMALLAPHRVNRLAVMSVGHPGVKRSLEQREKSWYMLLF